jgi:hypothetical protein
MSHMQRRAAIAKQVEKHLCDDDVEDVLTDLYHLNDSLLEALAFFLDDPNVDIAVGGNPHYVDQRYAEVRAIYAKATGGNS